MAHHIISHTSLRGLAAAVVFWGHYSDVFARNIAGHDLYFAHTHLGVDLFFMLSGFVLFHVYAENFAARVTLRRWGLFMRQRLLRIYPLHVATLLAVIVLARFALPEDGTKQLVLHLTLTHAWGLTDTFTFNAPSWSISAEFLAYLLFPFAVLATNTGWGRALLAAIALACAACLLWLGAGSLDLDAIGRTNVLLRVGLCFPIGVLLAWAIKVSPLRDATTASVLQMLGLMLAVVSLWLGFAEICLIPAFALIVFSTAQDAGFLAQILHWNPLRKLGVVSYGVYLLQWPVMVLMFNIEPWIKPVLNGLWLDLGRLVIVVTVLLVSAAASWAWFEAPLVNKGRKRKLEV